MESILSSSQKRLLAVIFAQGAETASRTLSRWLGHPVKMAVSDVDEVDVSEAEGLLGPGEELVAACILGISGRLSGLLVLVFEDASGLALADLLLNQPLGTAAEWGEMERSAALETANIVACAYLSSLAMHLPGDGEPEPIVPSPPSFRHEFAGSLIQFLLMGQALQFDRVLLVKSRFATQHGQLRWSLLFAPDGESLRSLSKALSIPENS